MVDPLHRAQLTSVMCGRAPYTARMDAETTLLLLSNATADAKGSGGMFGGFSGRTPAPMLWAGLIPGEMIARHLELSQQRWDQPGDGAGAEPGAHEPGAHEPGAHEPGASVSSVEQDLADGVFLIRWDRARAAYAERLDAFLLEQPGYTRYATVFLERLDELVHRAGAGTDGLDLEIDLDEWMRTHDAAADYIEEFGTVVAPWMWPGEGLGVAQGADVLGIDAMGLDVDRRGETSATSAAIGQRAAPQASPVRPPGRLTRWVDRLLGVAVVGIVVLNFAGGSGLRGWVIPAVLVCGGISAGMHILGPVLRPDHSRDGAAP